MEVFHFIRWAVTIHAFYFVDCQYFHHPRCFTCLNDIFELAKFKVRESRKKDKNTDFAFYFQKQQKVAEKTEDAHYQAKRGMDLFVEEFYRK